MKAETWAKITMASGIWLVFISGMISRITWWYIILGALGTFYIVMINNLEKQIIILEANKIISKTKKKKSGSKIKKTEMEKI